jgi:hypothetical protein
MGVDAVGYTTAPWQAQLVSGPEGPRRHRSALTRIRQERGPLPVRLWLPPCSAAHRNRRDGRLHAARVRVRPLPLQRRAHTIVTSGTVWRVWPRSGSAHSRTTSPEPS